MSLKITGFKNGTTPEEEYIELCATSDVELSEFAILDQTFKNGKVSNLHKHFYHLPNLKLSKGEYVKVFTGKGENKKMIKKTGGAVVYYRYWGLDTPVWNNSVKDKLELIKFEYIIKKPI